MADRQRERVGGVGRCRFLLQRKDFGDHRGDLRLARAPLPVTAAFTSLGVWKCTSMSRLAAASAITPPACAVPIAVDDVLLREHPLDRDDIGMVGVHPVLDGVADGEQPALQRFARRVRTTSTSSAMTCRPWPLSIMDSPHRVSPGSTPITRTPAPS